MITKFNKGLILTSLGSFWWGFIGVIYFEYVAFIGHIELVVHRCLWTAIMLILTSTLFSKWKIFFVTIKCKKNLIALFINRATTLLYTPPDKAQITLLFFTSLLISLINCFF